MDCLDRAIQYLGVDRDSVVDYRIYEDSIALIVDKGIAGSPKYVIPLSDLEKPKALDLIYEPEEEPEPDPLPVPAAIDLSLDHLSYRELQAMAKEAGIPANQKRDDLLEALEGEGYVSIL